MTKTLEKRLKKGIKNEDKIHGGLNYMQAEGIEGVKINPKLIKPLMKELDRMDEKYRMKYINIISDDIEKTIEKARKYAAKHNVNYEIALSNVEMVITPIPPEYYCKDGC